MAKHEQQTKPIGSTWTDEQWDAISLSGRDMLVAAAAGSGKTAVLVERIIRRISDESEPVDVDRLLVATFTKAAASEMKHRIREAFEKELTRQPKSHHLRKQLAMMGRASITTLHSFCLEVIQRYFSLIRLDPGFRIANETEAELLRQDLLEELLEEYYAGSEAESSFWRLVDSFSGDRSDDALMLLVQKLYDVSRSHPWPEQWLRLMASMFGPPGQTQTSTIDGVEAQRLVAAGSEAAVKEIWEKSLIQDCRLELNGAADLLRQARDLAEEPGGPAPYLDNLQEDLRLVEALIFAAKGSWNEMFLAFQGASFGKLKPCKGDGFDKELQEQVKELRNQAKERVGKIGEELFGRAPEQFDAEIRQLAPVLHTLVDLVLDFGRRYQSAKAEKGLIDFADLEHYCLQILSDPSSVPDGLIPSQAAIEYRRQFVEVLLDEYQDTNRVQEAIVEMISHPKPGNRFMVGDVKQSIYRFRLADPGLFLEKYKAYKSEPASGEGLRIDLARNFRSRTQVVDAVNFLFKQMMNESVGEIDYDDRAELIYGAGYPAPSGDCSVEMVIVDRASDSPDTEEMDALSDEHTDVEDQITDTEEGMAEGSDPVMQAMELETAQLEARAIAKQIRSMMDQAAPFEVFDKRTGGTRPVTYRDIVVLLRATSAWAPVFIEELKQQGIPAYADLSTGYFSATEVEVMLSLLKVIDNPYQDVPLAAVLRSPIVGLTADELAQIRAGSRTSAFYDAVVDYGASIHNSEPTIHKLPLFLNRLKQWRTDARQGSLADLIWSIYRQTGYYDFAGGLPGGLQRQANLRALYDRSRQYESTSLRGLFRFLRFVERMKDSGGDLGTARALGEQEDVVRIMSIHKSKGLEFPVVFAAGMAKLFNQRDLNDTFLLHKELGFGPRFVDTALRISYPTLPSLAIKRRMRLEMLAEEMRILYVALTRAREKLVLLGTVKSLDKLLRAWSRHVHAPDFLLPDYELAKARCYLDWIGPALLRHPDAELWRGRLGMGDIPADRLLKDPSQWKLTIVNPAELMASGEAAQSIPMEVSRIEALRHLDIVPTQEKWKEALERKLSWQYAYPNAQKWFAKTTVSELKRLSESNRMPQDLEYPTGRAFGTASFGSSSGHQTYRTTVLRRPRFMEEKKLTAAEKGTVVHAVMQNLSLDQQPTAESVRAHLDHMLERNLLTKAQFEVVDIKPVLTFFATDIGQRMIQARKVEREVPFSFGLPAQEVYTDAETDMTLSKETVLIQGVIDCFFEDDQGLVMVDYKTDSTEGRSIDELSERYRLQIDLYARAVEYIWNRPLAGKYVYYFDGDMLIQM